jgi:hypothetical protein
MVYKTGQSLELSLLWDIHQTLRPYAVDIVRIRYQETISEDIEVFMCAAVTVMEVTCFF